MVVSAEPWVIPAEKVSELQRLIRVRFSVALSGPAIVRLLADPTFVAVANLRNASGLAYDEALEVVKSVKVFFEFNQEAV